ncbi:hypothetical protein BBJ28_00021466 [Nothophytophthora sp. Chile5]|nr:hypothetical protein BBJ28_00021466 [Nothophytophthora sp. Chile5]
MAPADLKRPVPSLRAAMPAKPGHRAVDDDDPQAKQHKKTSGRGAGEDETLEPPTSPRVRRRLSNAQENASLFGPVVEQGEVIQWMTACHPELLAFGRDLERRGYRTLSSIAFLTDEDLESVEGLQLKQLLMATLSRLRHEIFRM